MTDLEIHICRECGTGTDKDEWMWRGCQKCSANAFVESLNPMKVKNEMFCDKCRDEKTFNFISILECETCGHQYNSPFFDSLENAKQFKKLKVVFDAAVEWARESREDLGHDKMNLTFLVQAICDYDCDAWEKACRPTGS